MLLPDWVLRLDWRRRFCQRLLCYCCRLTLFISITSSIDFREGVVIGIPSARFYDVFEDPHWGIIRLGEMVIFFSFLSVVFFVSQILSDSVCRCLFTVFGNEKMIICLVFSSSWFVDAACFSIIGINLKDHNYIKKEAKFWSEWNLSANLYSPEVIRYNAVWSTKPLTNISRLGSYIVSARTSFLRGSSIVLL